MRHALHDRNRGRWPKSDPVFDITDSDVFADQSLDITNVMIAFQGEPKKLIYFQDHVLMLKNPGRGPAPTRLRAISFPGCAQHRSTTTSMK
jgi:hypothetical protein